MPLFHLNVEDDIFVCIFFFFHLFSIHFHLESHLLRRDSVMTVHFLLPYSCMYIGLLHSVLDTVEHSYLRIFFWTHIPTQMSDDTELF
jgi:hypothetical protein